MRLREIKGQAIQPFRVIDHVILVYGFGWLMISGVEVWFRCRSYILMVVVNDFFYVEDMRLNKKEGNENKVSGFEIVRLNIREMQKNTATFSMTKSNLESNKIKIRSSEVVRIVTAFDPDNLKNVGSKYPYVKDLILLKIGKSYNAYYEYLCERRENEQDKGVFTLEIVDIDKDSKIKVLETIRYKRLLCGSSFVRNQKELYIKEEMYDKAMEVLLTGIETDASFPSSKIAKYSTYLGLAATDSMPVSMPNICVVRDFTKKIKDAFDIVRQTKDENNNFRYEVINFADTKEETEEDVNCFDGAGIVSYERAAIWAKELGLNYVPSSFQIRVLNGIKGNLYTFPVKEYIEYLEENNLQEHLLVKDLWDTLVNIKEQKIDVFLTESQFKFHGMYKSFEEWKTTFNTEVVYNDHSYRRTFNISEVSRNIGGLKDELWSAYQPLQTLDFTNDELKKLAEPTISMTKLLYTDANEFIKYRGIAIESDEEESGDRHCKKHDLTPWYYKALTLDDSLQYDPYIRKKIEHDLESLQRRVFMGKIILNGNYQTAAPDLLALMEHICGVPVVGILNKGQIYSNYWNKKHVEKVSIWRNPHIACEWINAGVIDNEDTKKWFKYQETNIIIDIYGTLALRLGTMDFDGDTIASVCSDIIYNAVECADIHTIRFIPYKDDESKKSVERDFQINDFSRIMRTNKLGFQNNIGDVTNKVTVLWALYGDTEDEAERKEISNYIKIMSAINQLIVDFVKTGIKVPIPKDILKLVSKVKKPAFMQNKNGRWVDDKKTEANAKNFEYILKEMADESEEYAVEDIINEQKKYELTNGTVDRLYKHLLDALSTIEMDFESSTEECQFTKLLKNIPYTYNATYPKVESRLKELLDIHNIICGKKYYDEKENSSIDDSTWRFDRFYSYCENELLDICSDRRILLNYIIHLFYTNENFYGCDKSILWNVFGEDICNRYIKKEINESVEELTKLAKKEKRAKVKSESIKKMCSNANIIHIKELPEKEILITDTELTYIADAVSDDKEAQRLMIALLALYRKVNAEHKKGKMKAIKISKGRKNEITMYQICKLADIHYNQIHNRLKLLHEKGLINIDIHNMKVPKIIACIPVQAKIHEEYQITDINDVRYKLLERMFA